MDYSTTPLLHSMQRGAIILCGGESSRMGRDKATLPFGPDELLLQRVVRLVAQAVPATNIACVAAPNQPLPSLPPEVSVVYDADPHRGPLAALAIGLKELEGRADVVFASGCDTPLLVPPFITRMFDLLGHQQIAAPHDGDRWHPLTAVYRTNLRPQIESLLDANKQSLVALLESCDTRRVPVAELRDVDPQLLSLIACNTPADYEAVQGISRGDAEVAE